MRKDHAATKDTIDSRFYFRDCILGQVRGHRERCGSRFSYVSIEERVQASHPLRRIRKLADQARDRANLTFCELYTSEGRPSVPPEQLLLASLLHPFY